MRTVILKKRLGFLLVVFGVLILGWLIRALQQPSTNIVLPRPIEPMPIPAVVLKKESSDVGASGAIKVDPVQTPTQAATTEKLDPVALPDPVAIDRLPSRNLTAELMAEFSSITLLGLKQERRLELWGHRGSGIETELLRVYPFTGFSGTLGPKLREGDGQIPEGIYRIEYLNPHSSYHRSMKLDYPNAWDRAKGLEDERPQLGFDIFIHGSFLTVGCIPIGDKAIEELFTVVEDFGYRRAAVIIAPWDFRVREDHPEIEAIDWELELYSKIREAILERRLVDMTSSDPAKLPDSENRD